MRTSESVKAITIGLVNAQNKIKHAIKDANNPHYRNDYASLESVIDATKEELLKNDIATLQGMSPDGSTLTTRLQHSSGEFIETEMKLVLSKQDMQGLGSAITYARRYALAAIMNISQADDDGNEASGKPQRRQVENKKAKPANSTSTSNDDF